MSNFSELNSLLKEQAAESSASHPDIYNYARCIAEIENAVTVVSDLKNSTSRIFCGSFAGILGIDGYSEENSIWEKKILSMMSEKEQDEKFIAELRFFHFLRSRHKSRKNYYLMSRLRFTDTQAGNIDILHRMYYIFDDKTGYVRYAICIYGPLVIDFKGKSIAVNSLTGKWEELTPASGYSILSNRELQILRLIDSGMKSADIAIHLNISRHTVSRHRQEILAKMQVKNSIEACRLAKSMELI